MREHSVQNKKAWEYSAYEFWVKQYGSPEERAKKDAENHGFGLKSIESTAKKYDGEMLTKFEDGVFTLVIKLNASQ